MGGPELQNVIPTKKTKKTGVDIILYRWATRSIIIVIVLVIILIPAVIKNLIGQNSATESERYLV